MSTEEVPEQTESPPVRRLFLDDDPNRAHRFLTQFPDAVWVQTVPECIEKLAESWDEIHLDHDLGGETFVDILREDCGMEVVRWLVREPRPHLNSAKFTIHTWNPDAGILMLWHLESVGYQAVERPFGTSERSEKEENERHTQADLTQEDEFVYPYEPYVPPKPASLIQRIYERLRGRVVLRVASQDSQPLKLPDR